MVTRLKVTKADYTAPPDWNDFYIIDQDGRRLSPWMGQAYAKEVLSILDIIKEDAAAFHHALASLAVCFSPDKEKERHTTEYWAAFLQETPPHWPSSRMPCEVEPGSSSYWAERAREHDRQTAQAEAEHEADYLTAKMDEL